MYCIYSSSFFLNIFIDVRENEWLRVYTFSTWRTQISCSQVNFFSCTLIDGPEWLKWLKNWLLLDMHWREITYQWILNYTNQINYFQKLIQVYMLLQRDLQLGYPTDQTLPTILNSSPTYALHPLCVPTAHPSLLAYQGQAFNIA